MAINSNPGQTSTGGPSQTSRPNQPETVSLSRPSARRPQGPARISGFTIAPRKYPPRPAKAHHPTSVARVNKGRSLRVACWAGLSGPAGALLSTYARVLGLDRAVSDAQPRPEPPVGFP